MWYLNNGQPYTGDRIHPDDLEIAACPSPQHRWNGEAWELEPRPDWEGLMNDIRGTEVYAKVYTAANDPEANTIAALKKTIQANTAFTLLQDTFKSQNLQDLQFAITTLRALMADISTVGDFTTEQLQWINQKLSDRGFPIQLNS